MRKIHAWKQLHSYNDFQNFMGKKYVHRIYKYLSLYRDFTDDSYYVKYQNTRIVTFYANGNVTINNGGYQTQTTKKYINMFACDYVYIYQRDFNWYCVVNQITLHKTNAKLVVSDGIKLQ